MKHTVLFLLSIIMLGGCASASHRNLTNPQPPRPRNHPVEVYVQPDAKVVGWLDWSNLEEELGSYTKGKPQAATIQTGEILSTGAWAASWGTIVENAKAAAREQGGDVILIYAVGTVYDQNTQRKSQKALQAYVLRYTEAAASQPIQPK